MGFWYQCLHSIPTPGLSAITSICPHLLRLAFAQVPVLKMVQMAHFGVIRLTGWGEGGCAAGVYTVLGDH